MVRVVVVVVEEMVVERDEAEVMSAFPKRMLSQHADRSCRSMYYLEQQFHVGMRSPALVADASMGYFYTCIAFTTEPSYSGSSTWRL